MKSHLWTLFLLSVGVFAQEKVETPRDAQLQALAKANLKSFADEVSKAADSELGKSQLVVKWLAEHFEWKATDYQKRTVKEIIDRGGGNCNELAMVAVECFQELNIPMRKVREVNIYKEDSSRGARAKVLVKGKGYGYSVFGRHHNDHMWLEIHDSKRNEWYPADPSIGLVGTKEWLESRAGFGKRYSLNPISEDMVVPFAIFAADENGKFTVSRTRHYMVEGFNRLYDGKLEKLDKWGEWVRLLDELDENVEGAFDAKTNLHAYEKEIDKLAKIYEDLRSGYLSR